MAHLTARVLLGGGGGRGAGADAAEIHLVRHTAEQDDAGGMARRAVQQAALGAGGAKGGEAAGRSGRGQPQQGRCSGRAGADKSAFWSTARRPAGGRDPGTEVFLGVQDRAPERAFDDDQVLSVACLCLNRDLPGKLPYGGGHPRLSLVEGVGAVEGIACITPPTPTVRLTEAQGRRWTLVSHLLLNHLSLSGREGLIALKEILTLYNVRNSAEATRMIDSIASLAARRGVARAPRRPGDPAWADAMCRGIDLELEFSSDPGFPPYLFAMVLDRFFGLYASINAFTRLTAFVKGQPEPLRKWPARAGFRPLV